MGLRSDPWSLAPYPSYRSKALDYHEFSFRAEMPFASPCPRRFLLLCPLAFVIALPGGLVALEAEGAVTGLSPSHASRSYKS